jgi:2-polyprenyl-3-methyl-5-hydroxy-6-metoxy-1,4-benzoquinol methylase
MEMSDPEFNQYAQKYDQLLGESIPDALNDDAYFAEYKIALMANRLRHNAPKRILDFGCGAGRSLSYLDTYFPAAEIWGYDLSDASLKIAQARLPRAHLRSEWSEIQGQRFDAIIAANVFHHIPVEDRAAALSNCRKALADVGSMFIFEHNPRNPMTRRIFERCPFDADASMLTLDSSLSLGKMAGFRDLTHGYTLFFPKPLSALRGLERFMEWLPLGAQYYVQMAG